MTDREKLIALLRNFFESIYTAYLCTEFVLCSLADFLITNGAVVREKGEWVWDKRFSDYKCSICGGYDMGKSAFCRNCGADMRKGENG